MMAEPSTPKRKWDAFVRLSHWAIVAGVVANGFVFASGSQAHILAGYALGIMLTARLIWGFVGPEAARFSAFPPSLSRAANHLREIAAGTRTDHTSHNPLGALMVYSIWITLSVIVATGAGLAWLEQDRTEASAVAPKANAAQRFEEPTEAAEAGEAAEHDAEATEESALTEIHELSVNILYALIVAHLGGVLFETRRSGTQIVKSMMP